MKQYIQNVDKPIRVNWEGSLFVHHSLGMVNRELLCELYKDSRLQIGHVAFESNQFIPEKNSKFCDLFHLQNKPLHDPDIYIRHRWPPDFSRPEAAKFILIQPWEYGSLPEMWVRGINEFVDEVWVYTSYLKMCYVRSGISEEKVQIVPCGVDPDIFNPESKPSKWVTEVAKGRFCFFFNGGNTLRKGIDILINAYLSEFRSDEPVCLVIKDSQMYEKNIAKKIQELSTRTDIAYIAYTEQNFSHDELPGLYTACDCYVHPYRAEGYGLPIAEAMACGKPVIVTGAGACLDFVEPDTGYFIKSTIEKMKENNVSGLQTVDRPFWMVPDMRHLQSLMRYVYKNSDAARKRGCFAGEKIRTEHTWEHAAKRAAERIIALVTGVGESLQQLLAIAEDYMRMEDIDNAILTYQKVLILYGDNYVAFEGMAKASLKQNHYRESFDLFRRANLLNPGCPRILINWYKVARIIGRQNELIEPALRALEISNDDAELVKLIGLLNCSS